MEERPVELGYSLADNGWIKVVYMDGTEKEVSLRTAFADAPKIKKIQGDIPQQDGPILRILVAILLRCYPLPDGDDEQAILERWKSIWDEGSFQMESIEDYLSFCEDRFDLFSDSHPFFQVADLAYADGSFDGVEKLVADVPDKGDRFLFSMRSKGFIRPLRFSEAARWLIFQQMYAPAGIKTPVVGNTHVQKGKVYPPKGYPGTGLMGAMGLVYLEGKNLFETLMLNLVLSDDIFIQRHDKADSYMTGGAPSWEEDKGPDLVLHAAGDPKYPIEAYTWQSRRMRLVPTDDGTAVKGVVSCYGDIPNVTDADGAEMMTCWRARKQSKQAARTERLPLDHDPSRKLWQGLAALISASGTDGDLRPGVIRWLEKLCPADGREGLLSPEAVPHIGIHAEGMVYGTQSSVFTDAVDDKFDLSIALVNHESVASAQAIDVIRCADDAVGKLSYFVVDMQRAAGASLSGAKSVQPIQSQVRELAYGRLDAICRRRLAGFPFGEEEGISYCKDWKDEIHRCLLDTAQEYVEANGISFFSGHEGMTAGRAIALLQGNLNKALGRLSAAKDAVGKDSSAAGSDMEGK